MPTQQASRPSWGVVMPFYRNLATIDACLSSFLHQSAPPSEIVVCDDGSLDAEAHRALSARWPLPVVILARPHGGQSACTNHAIRHARSDYVLLTCADIIAPPNLLQLHRDAHAQRDDEVAVLGPLPYAPSVPMTPLMRYLSVPGVQFCFNEMTDPEHVDPMHCYAPNVSVSRTALLDVGLFDESFTYGLQDVDLGRRLGEAGLRFVLEPRAFALHGQGTTLEGYLRRQWRVGQAHVRWLEKYPDAAMAQQLGYALRAARVYNRSFEDLLQEAGAVYAPYDTDKTLAAYQYDALFAAMGGWFGLAAGLGAQAMARRLHALVPLYAELRRDSLGL